MFALFFMRRYLIFFRSVLLLLYSTSRQFRVSIWCFYRCFMVLFTFNEYPNIVAYCPLFSFASRIYILLYIHNTHLYYTYYRPSTRYTVYTTHTYIIIIIIYIYCDARRTQISNKFDGRLNNACWKPYEL